MLRSAAVMWCKSYKLSLLLTLALGPVASGCGTDDAGEPSDPTMADDDYPLSELDPLFEDAPSNDELPEEGKADQVLPAQFDLVATQSPVKSQGSRGVCSIFGTTALMEHLYIVEGTLGVPDFSEQFLQWSTKVELGRFTNTSGSNTHTNLQALNRFGSVLEDEWPYETFKWGTSQDEACAGDGMPVRCYTNGEPPQAAMTAQRFHLPRGRWINSRARSIQSHMINSNTAVQVGGDFFYQAWNHRKTTLPRSSEFQAYRNMGYVLPPNPEDRRDSSGERRAGHSFLLVGWDDELEVQAVDGQGELRTDEAGDPVMVKGFFLFKNSWGTGWASNNPFGAGYGWIAYDYVEDLTAYASGIPEVNLMEICGDGRDNDHNGAADCADAACASDRACSDPADGYQSREQVDIPDNDPAGATSTINVQDGGIISGLSVTVDIAHSYIGDLTVELKKGSTTVTLVDREGAGADDLARTFDVSEFDGIDSAGTWELHVVDHANADEGRIRGWSLNITRCADGDCGTMPEVSRYTNDTLRVIPDNDEAGVTSDIEVTDSGSVAAVRVIVNLTHPYSSDLAIQLTRGTQVVELARNEEIGPMQSFTVDDFNDTDSMGTWTLTIADLAARDQGTLNSWTLEITH